MFNGILTPYGLFSADVWLLIQLYFQCTIALYLSIVGVGKLFGWRAASVDYELSKGCINQKNLVSIQVQVFILFICFLEAPVGRMRPAGGSLPTPSLWSCLHTVIVSSITLSDLWFSNRSNVICRWYANMYCHFGSENIGNEEVLRTWLMLNPGRIFLWIIFVLLIFLFVLLIFLLLLLQS